MNILYTRNISVLFFTINTKLLYSKIYLSNTYPMKFHKVPGQILFYRNNAKTLMKMFVEIPVNYLVLQCIVVLNHVKNSMRRSCLMFTIIEDQSLCCGCEQSEAAPSH